ncbi:hypothetical protein [Spirochaeta isovalerica]|uniref:Thioredoxin domain-containing protein n=1 Tax=Spirochaeta isovalerica TaxID=150 RepID=A0A841RB18_9SPIO|nr:hypothetical protein [Spirochaeta isovalerica]MBB6480551.1 hypothetical protein [Spirochaeta isovalerica]
MTEITDAQAMSLIQNREIPAQLISSGKFVAVVLTQDWCPQWLFMKRWLAEMEKEGVKVYYLSYNRKPYFHDFMNVKESIFNNDQVPYVRYYVNGEFAGDSNYVGRELFLSNFRQGAEL